MKKILIANRGEISMRIIRSIREYNLSPVVIFSEADANAMHVRFADEAYCIGKAPASESYLNIQKIIQVAQKCRAFAIHPGYGFLAENADFARACEKAKIEFLGPRAKTIALMGDKLEARKVAHKARLPTILSSLPFSTLGEAQKAAHEIACPALLKARSGGGRQRHA